MSERTRRHPLIATVVGAVAVLLRGIGAMMERARRTWRAYFWRSVEVVAGVGLAASLVLLLIESWGPWDALRGRRVDYLATFASLFVGFVALIGLEFARRTSEATVKHRFTDRKQALYADLWVACDRHRQEVANQVAWRRGARDGKSPTVGSSEPAERASLALDVLPVPKSVRASASKLFWETRELGANFARREEDPWTPGAEWEAALGGWHAAALALLEVTREDLRDPQ